MIKNFFNISMFELYKSKYEKNVRVIEVANKICDVIDSGNKLDDDEKWELLQLLLLC